MKPLYVPKGKAKEYGDYAVNIYTGCPHRCYYCVDAVPVVRCKDCKHAKRYERADGTAGYSCGHPQNIFVYGERLDRVFEPIKEPDDFCSSGERKAKND